MRVLITGSSGQIGTNLGLRLLRDGHDVFGVDKRQNPWTDAFPTLLQDLAGHYPAFEGGIGGVEYPHIDVVVHLAAHAKVHQLVREPHRALENAIMTFNVLEFARGLGLPLVFSSTREVYGDVHRFEEYAEEAADFAYTESPYSASKITSEAFIYSYARCYGLTTSSSASRTSTAATTTTCGGWSACCRSSSTSWLARRADHDLRRRRQGARLHVRRRLRRRDRPRRVRARRRARRQRDDQPRLRPGQHARPRGRADRGRAGRRGRHHDGAVAARRGDALRRRRHARHASCSSGSRRRRSTEGIPQSVAWFREWRAAHPEEERPFERARTATEIDHGFKQPARTAG